MCVRVIDIGQSSHYWNSSAQSRRKGIKNENRTSFDDSQCHLLLEDFPFVTQAKWVVEYLRWVTCIMQFLILIISWQTLLYIIVTFFSKWNRVFSSNNLILISILHSMLLVWISPYLWMRLYIHNNSQTKLVWANSMYQISPAVHYMRARDTPTEDGRSGDCSFTSWLIMRCHFVSIRVTMFDGDQQVQFFRGILLQLTLLFSCKTYILVIN